VDHKLDWFYKTGSWEGVCLRYERHEEIISTLKISQKIILWHYTRKLKEHAEWTSSNRIPKEMKTYPKKIGKG
jgi:hypothetical protein